MRQLVYAIFIINNHASFHLWWKGNLVKHQKASKYYDHDCLQNFSLLFIYRLIVPIVKSYHILVRIYFIFLKIGPWPNFKIFKTKIQFLFFREVFASIDKIFILGRKLSPKLIALRSFEIFLIFPNFLKS